ncbi:MAG: O-acetyl-ADP-ribose deacetylase [Planctomycetaceae bacterium]|nr:O-acetyl-ADP-ribose deacetylase [Planctomycetaceae bacterium]
MRVESGNGVIELVLGDITKQAVDGIVNAANAALAGGGGVDGAIHRAGGPSILEECRAIGGCPTGQTVITGAGRLPAKHVLHTVGPVWHGGGHGEADLLASCYKTALELARDNGLKSLAFASISTGIYGYPVTQAAAIAIREIAAFLAGNDHPSLVRMALFDQHTYDAYAAALSAQEQ